MKNLNDITSHRKTIQIVADQYDIIVYWNVHRKIKGILNSVRISMRLGMRELKHIHPTFYK